MFDFFNWPEMAAIGTLAKWFGFGGLSVAGCIAGAIFLPGPFRQYFILGAVCLSTLMTAYTKGVYDDAVFQKARLKAAEEAAFKRGQDAHANAVRDVARGVRDKRNTDTTKQKNSVRPVRPNP